MRPGKVILMLLGFLLLHEGHAIWAWMEAAEWVAVDDSAYALVTDLTNAFAFLLVALVLHSQTQGPLRQGSAFMAVYMAIQAVWLVADPLRCDTLASEIATIGIASWFLVAHSYLSNLQGFPKIRTHP